MLDSGRMPGNAALCTYAEAATEGLNVSDTPLMQYRLPVGTCTRCRQGRVRAPKRGVCVCEREREREKGWGGYEVSLLAKIGRGGLGVEREGAARYNKDPPQSSNNTRTYLSQDPVVEDVPL